MSKARDLAGLFNLGPRSGTTAQRPATADVGDIYYNGTTGKTEIYTTTGWKEMASGIPFGNTAGRPTAVTGQPYFNGETNRLELYTAGSGWQNIIQEVPGVASITGTYSEASNSGTITISGTNFVSGAIASAIGTNGVEVIASSTTYNSLVQLTAVFTGLSNANEPYDIKVTNPSNLFGMIPDALYINASPVWQTPSGSLGTFFEQVSITLSALSATDSDSTVTYALASGSTLPSGVTLNSSTGVISGTLPDVATNTTYSFTINATDGLNIIPRTFSISSSATATSVDYLVVAGGGSGAGDYGGGGGAGGMKYGTLGVAYSSSYTVTVGQGATGTTGASIKGNNGNPSVFASISTTGGGGGGAEGNWAGLNGGSGGGSGYNAGAGGATGGTGISGEGFGGGSATNNYGTPYYPASGGGGAGGAGNPPANASTGGAGGIGLQSSITGTTQFYAGGGGGGGETGATGAAGGSGIGGTGGYSSNNGSAGAANTGSGGGGGKGDAGTGGAGGSGIVVIAYPNTFAPITTISGTLTYDQPTRSGYRVYRFTAGSGTVTF